MNTIHKLPSDVEIVIDNQNKRVKLVECGELPSETAAVAIQVARNYKYEKIWGFVAPDIYEKLANIGFVREGILDGYYEDMPGIAVAFYLTENRSISKFPDIENTIVQKSLLQKDKDVPALPAGYDIRMAGIEDASEISNLFKSVFATYPTPVSSAEDIINSMESNVYYSCITKNNKIVAISSADIDFMHQVAEMTDCAVLPDYRGKGLVAILLRFLETKIQRLKLRSLYTLARATSAPMNMTFARLNYSFTGRLVNNCHIAGDWEDMNLWVKKLHSITDNIENE